METALSRPPYLVGEKYSLADVAATSYVNRAEMIAMDGLWEHRPHVADWLRRIRSSQATTRRLPLTSPKPTNSGPIFRGKRRRKGSGISSARTDGGATHCRILPAETTLRETPVNLSTRSSSLNPRLCRSLGARKFFSRRIALREAVIRGMKPRRMIHR